MKKTLFAVAALALCGTAVAETKTYYASDYQNQDFSGVIFGNGSNVVFVVDEPATLNSFQAFVAGSMTLSFVGEDTISVNGMLDLEANKGAGPLAVIGDSTAKEYWYTALTSEDITSVTLASGTGSFYAPSTNTSFEGLTESGSITLGNATVDYVGYHKVAGMGAAKALITGDNQIALVTITGTKQLALVGKITGSPATPEPATATLSLLALAGLATRRRRK